MSTRSVSHSSHTREAETTKAGAQGKEEPHRLPLLKRRGTRAVFKARSPLSFRLPCLLFSLPPRAEPLSCQEVKNEHSPSASWLLVVLGLFYLERKRAAGQGIKEKYRSSTFRLEIASPVKSHNYNRCVQQGRAPAAWNTVIMCRRVPLFHKVKTPEAARNKSSH